MIDPGRNSDQALGVEEAVVPENVPAVQGTWKLHYSQHQLSRPQNYRSPKVRRTQEQSVELINRHACLFAQLIDSCRVRCAFREQSATRGSEQNNLSCLIFRTLRGESLAVCAERELCAHAAAKINWPYNENP